MGRPDRRLRPDRRAVARRHARRRRNTPATTRIDVEYWPIFDPTGLGETRDAKLAAYRQARDQIERRIRDRFGPPEADEDEAPS